MIILYACLILVLTHALLPGSDLRRLGQIRLRHTWLVWLALADQIVVISVLPDLGAVSQGAHFASYALAALFALLNNRSAGTWIVGLGGSATCSRSRPTAARCPPRGRPRKRQGGDPHPGTSPTRPPCPTLAWPPSGTCSSIPSWFPVHSVFSIGDVVIVLGVALFLHSTCRSTDQREAPEGRAVMPSARPRLSRTSRAIGRLARLKA